MASVSAVQKELARIARDNTENPEIIESAVPPPKHYPEYTISTPSSTTVQRSPLADLQYVMAKDVLVAHSLHNPYTGHVMSANFSGRVNINLQDPITKELDEWEHEETVEDNARLWTFKKGDETRSFRESYVEGEKCVRDTTPDMKYYCLRDWEEWIKEKKQEK